MRHVVRGEKVVRPEPPIETPGELLRIKAAAWIAGGALLIGALFLGAAVYLDDAELRTWATSLISLVVGTAIGFVFSSMNGRT